MFLEKEQEFVQNTWKPPGRPVDGPQLARARGFRQKKTSSPSRMTRRKISSASRAVVFQRLGARDAIAQSHGPRDP